jgi:hypothetical protein
MNHTIKNSPNEIIDKDSDSIKYKVVCFFSKLNSAKKSATFGKKEYIVSTNLVSKI